MTSQQDRYWFEYRKGKLKRQIRPVTWFGWLVFLSCLVIHLILIILAFEVQIFGSAPADLTIAGFLSMLPLILCGLIMWVKTDWANPQEISPFRFRVATAEDNRDTSDTRHD